MPDFRPFNPNTDKFLSVKTVGNVIKSLRKFGVELETVSETPNQQDKAISAIPKEWGADFDRSINGATGGTGVEYVSPILGGLRGERAIRNVCATLRDNGLHVDSSCGMHIHLDGTEFIHSTKLLKQTFRSFQQEFVENNIIWDSLHRYFIVDSTTLRTIRTETGLEEEDVAYAIQKFIRSKNGYRRKKSHSIVLVDRTYVFDFSNAVLLKSATFQDVVNLDCFTLRNEEEHKKYKEQLRVLDTKLKEIDIALRQAQATRLEPSTTSAVVNGLERDYRELSHERNMLNNSINSNVRVECRPLDKVFFTGKDKAFVNCKNLLYFYTAFTDVLLAMLPKGRREQNTHCQRLDKAFSLYDIYALRTQDQLEALWYKNTDTMEIDRRKHGNKYDQSRYYGLNFHRLFQKGTVEIRMHNGTLNDKMILYWVSLHQTIVDKIVNGEINTDQIREASDRYSLQDKMDSMIELLQLRPNLQKYLKARINHFINPENLKCVE